MKMLCTCIHPSQDKLHGKQMRIFNQGIKSASCTVCGASAKSDTSSSKSNKKK